MHTRAALLLSALALAFPAHARNRWCARDRRLLDERRYHERHGRRHGCGHERLKHDGAMMGGGVAATVRRAPCTWSWAHRNPPRVSRAPRTTFRPASTWAVAAAAHPSRAAPAGATRICQKAWKNPRPHEDLLGCGDNVGAGQPVIIDFAKVAAGQRPPNMVSRQIKGASGPALGRNRTYGDCPTLKIRNPSRRRLAARRSSRPRQLLARNQVSHRRAPRLHGAGVVLPARQNAFRRHAGAMENGPNGYGLLRHRHGRRRRHQRCRDVVIERSAGNGRRADGFVPPAEVARLIREKVVMPPQTTECTVPARCEGTGHGFLRFVAYAMN